MTMATIQDLNNFNKNCGEILRYSVSTENILEHFLANYFTKIYSKEYFIFMDNILIKMNFQDKRILFREICKNEDLDYKKIVSAIEFIQITRNKIAHWSTQLDNGEFKLQENGSPIKMKKTINPTNKLVQDILEKRLFIIDEIKKTEIELIKKKQSEHRI